MSDGTMRVDAQNHDPYMQLDLLSQAKAGHLLPDNVVDRLTRMVFANAGLFVDADSQQQPAASNRDTEPVKHVTDLLEQAGLPATDMNTRLTIADYLRGRSLPGYTNPDYARRAFGKKLRKVYEDTYGYAPPCIDRGGYTAYGYVEADRPLFDKVFDDLSTQHEGTVTF